MATIKSKVKNFTGVRASVMFVNGVGKTDKPWLMEWFSNHGYDVSEDSEELSDRVKTKPIDDMTVEEIKSYLKSIGKGALIGNVKDREKLIAKAKKIVEDMQKEAEPSDPENEANEEQEKAGE